MPASQTLTASRNATWAPPLAYIYAGAALPLTGATIKMQVRSWPGAVDPALLTLTFTPTDVDNGDGTRTLTLDPGAGFTPAALAAAFPSLVTPDPGDPANVSFDIRITYADGVSEILSSGSFIVSPGVTTV